VGVVLPVLFLVSLSLRGVDDISNGGWLPTRLRWDNWPAAFQTVPLARMLTNSWVIAAGATLLTAVIAVPTAYLTARGALATAWEYTLGTSRPWLLSDSERAAADPYVLANYGRLVSSVRAVQVLADEVGAELARADAAGASLTWEGRGEPAELIAALKVASTDVALHVTSTIFEVTGARATSNAVGLDRFWRNVRTHTPHDPVAYKQREVGDHFLNGTHPPFTLYT
jgi:alkylation response protein AidB-like acyl-CoA dehydrogenase